MPCGAREHQGARATLLANPARDAKRREEEMKDDGKEWTQEEQDAAIGVERPYSHGGSRARTQSGGEGRLGIRRGFVQDVALSRGCREDASL